MRHFILVLLLSLIALVASQPRGTSRVRGIAQSRKLQMGMGMEEAGKEAEEEPMKEEDGPTSMEEFPAMSNSTNTTNATMPMMAMEDETDAMEDEGMKGEEVPDDD